MTLDLQHLRLRDWRQAFGPGDFRRGQSYASEGRSYNLRFDQGLLLASCRGSSADSYQQRIRLAEQDGSWHVEGRCSCPVAWNCKHVVSALLTLEQLQQGNTDIPGAPPPPKPIEDLPDCAPIPVLTLGSHSAVHFDARKGRMAGQTQHRAALSFLYHGYPAFGRQTPRELLVQGAQGQRLRIQRQLEQESQHRQRLQALGFSIALRRSEALPEAAGEPFELEDDRSWLDFMSDGLPVLREAGWQLRIPGDFHFNLAQVDDWYASVESPEADWFDLELGIVIDGQQVSLLPILLHAIRHAPWLLNPDALQRKADDEVLLVPLPREHGHGKRIALNYGRLRPLLACLGELFLREDPAEQQRLRLARADAGRLAELDSLPALHWQGGEQLRELARHLQNPPPQVGMPQGLQAELRDYQRDGVAWMQALGASSLGGVLADDMGLGKTLQTLTHILLEKETGRLTQPVLLVVPTSLIPNWQDEAARFAPDLKVLALHGQRRRARFASIGEHDLIITSYALLPRDIASLQEQPWHMLILDEAQNIKNPRSRASTALAKLRSRQRLCLSGTPLENHLGELWALFNFLLPGWLGDQKSFNQCYRTPIEKQGNVQRLAWLVAKVRPFMLRRTKEQVAPELPPKTEIIQRIDLSDRQRDSYEALRLTMDRKVRGEIARMGMARSQLVILEALLRLRQACCDLRLLGGEETEMLNAGDSGKLSALLEMLDELLSEGRRILLFSQFTGMLDLIAAELKARKVKFVTLTGSTRDRRTPVESFQAGKVPVFLISLKAGGAGLNLTAADTVIHFDPWWNPAAEAQASDRAYRIGQDKPVFVYKLIARGSVEEKIQQLQQTKAELARNVLDGELGGNWQLASEDLDALLAPLPV